jgi:hypothetical protein
MEGALGAFPRPSRGEVPRGSDDLVIESRTRLGEETGTRAVADHIIRTTSDRLGGLEIAINNDGGSSAPGGGVLALTTEPLGTGVQTESVSAVHLD